MLTAYGSSADLAGTNDKIQIDKISVAWKAMRRLEGEGFLFSTFYTSSGFEKSSVGVISSFCVTQHRLPSTSDLSLTSNLPYSTP
jgi:hypothetical protein